MTEKRLLTEDELREYDREQGEINRLETEGFPKPGEFRTFPDGITCRYHGLDSVCTSCGRIHHWEPCERCGG